MSLFAQCPASSMMSGLGNCMIETRDLKKIVERALLVGAYTEPNARGEAASLLEELEELVDTLGIPVVDRLLVHHREQHARLLIGSGKADEIVARVKEQNLDVIVF